ncbi:MAG TPA: adenylate/guanylate cyclase domain-containing protein [Chloroflexota bacterium]|nr:adenylate/guanylate cyclase domain-containing protein [Chloroflexota bacterium]
MEMNGGEGQRDTTVFAVSPAPLTFLIADVRGYTSFTVEHGDEAAARLARRFAEICDGIVGTHGGRVIELRGDEALAVFPSTRAALRAAIALQTRFAETMVDDPSLPLHVGIGLDAGEAVPVNDGYRGAALNLAARLCSIAGPGEILVSDAVTYLAGRVDGVAYAGRGQMHLKGFTEPVAILEVKREQDQGVAETVPPEGVWSRHVRFRSEAF